MLKYGFSLVLASVLMVSSLQLFAQPPSQSGYESFPEPAGSQSVPARPITQQPMAAVAEAAQPTPLTDIEEQLAQSIADSTCRFQCLQCCLCFRSLEDSTCRYGGTFVLAAGVALSGVSIPAGLPASIGPILQWVGLGSVVAGHGCQLASSCVHSRAENDARISARVRQILAERARR